MARPHDTGKRQSILESAFSVFGELGFQRATMKAIAEGAGITPGSIYIYFQDKGALFESTVKEGWEQFLTEFQSAVVSSQPFLLRLDYLIDLGFRKLKEGLPLLQGMLFEANQRRLFHSELAILCRTLEELFLEGQKQGILDLHSDSSHWKKLIRVTTVGILFSVALAPPNQIDAEIEALRAAVKRLLFDRTQAGGKA